MRAEKYRRMMFLEAFFSHSRKLFSEFPYKIFVIALHKIIGVQNFSLSFCKSKFRITMCNLHWCYTFCTGVTLFALVLHLNCTALSQSESSNFFMCIIKNFIEQLSWASWRRIRGRSFQLCIWLVALCCRVNKACSLMLQLKE